MNAAWIIWNKKAQRLTQHDFNQSVEKRGWKSKNFRRIWRGLVTTPLSATSTKVPQEFFKPHDGLLCSLRPGLKIKVCVYQVKTSDI